MARSDGIEKVTLVMATAVGVAHTTLFFMFFWQGSSGSVFRFVWAGIAALGFASNFIGWSLAKHGALKRIKKFGRWAIAFSTALAALLLFVAS